RSIGAEWRYLAAPLARATREDVRSGGLSWARRRDGGQGARARRPADELIVANRLRNVAAHLGEMTAFLTFASSARVSSSSKRPGGTDDDDVACRRIRGSARMRQSRMWHWRAGARLSIASHHDDRAVPCGWPHRYARASSGRRYAGLARPDYHHRERERDCRSA